MATPVLLEVEDLNAHYDKSHILHGVTMKIGAGEIVSLLGRNGSGRSTTLTLIGDGPPPGGASSAAMTSRSASNIAPRRCSAVTGRLARPAVGPRSVPARSRCRGTSSDGQDHGDQQQQERADSQQRRADAVADVAIARLALSARSGTISTLYTCLTMSARIAAW